LASLAARGGRPDGRPRLLRTHAPHYLSSAEIGHLREQELPDIAVAWLVDPETRQQLQVDPRDRRLPTRFAADATAERRELERLFGAVGVPHAVVSTSGDWLRTLVRFLELEQARR